MAVQFPDAGVRLVDSDGKPTKDYYIVLRLLFDQANASEANIGDVDSGLDSKATLAQDWSESVYIEFPDNKRYPFPNVAGVFEIETTTSQCDSGTCTVTFDIAGTPLGGTANAASTSLQSQAHTSANEHADGQELGITVSANASCEGLRLTMRGTRTLD